ncbi:MAG TPA: flagellar motor protein MotB [Vicinamibacterales bacterium]|nr:flagellar motor protein MotB [Vicinamibacterales bacterium]
MKGHGDHPVIVVRRKVHGHAHHGGAWKVAYADFVTAMMAFFLVMWLAAQDSRIRTAVAGYFQEPGLLPHQQSNAIVAAGQGGIDNAGMPTLIQRKPNGLLEAEQKALITAAEHIKQHMMQMPGYDALRDQVEFIVTSEGLRIELIDQSNASFFDSGSSTLRTETVNILRVIAQEIGKLENTVVVEGHTDSRQYARADRYGNWELSSDRANAARRVMLDQGLRAGQVRAVRGFADTELRNPADALDPRNRRVSIVVRTQDAANLDMAVRSGATNTGTPPPAGDAPAPEPAAPPPAKGGNGQAPS